MDKFDKEKVILRLKDIMRFILDVISEIELSEKAVPTEKEMNAILKEKAERKKESKSEEKLYKIAKSPCKYCQGLVSWDGFVKGSGMHPKHVNPNGTVKGDGECPNYQGGD